MLPFFASVIIIKTLAFATTIFSVSMADDVLLSSSSLDGGENPFSANFLLADNLLAADSVSGNSNADLFLDDDWLAPGGLEDLMSSSASSASLGTFGFDDDYDGVIFNPSDLDLDPDPDGFDIAAATAATTSVCNAENENKNENENAKSDINKLRAREGTENQATATDSTCTNTQQQQGAENQPPSSSFWDPPESILDQIETTINPEANRCLLAKFPMNLCCSGDLQRVYSAGVPRIWNSIRSCYLSNIYLLILAPFFLLLSAGCSSISILKKKTFFG